MPIDSELLRQVMRSWTSGVTIVTASYGLLQHGMTVSSFTSISLNPPWIMISLQKASRTHDLVVGAGSFGVTILSAAQKEISERFAGRIPDAEDRMTGLKIKTLETGAPLLKDGLSWLDCRVVQTIPAGTNTLFIAEVVAARGGPENGQPLVYHNQDYHQIKN
jgi:flavin reductase (DIM6/NTAB) family NADH-FMN oxidoreductase RutF